MAPQAEELMNLKAASRFMKCSVVTVRRMVARGSIPSLRLPGTRLLRFRPSSLEQVIAAIESSATNEKGNAA